MPRFFGAEHAVAAELAEGEKPLGVYENESDASVMFTTNGLRIGNRPLVCYQNITAATAMGDKETAVRIELRLCNGVSEFATFDGGNGRFRDVWEILRLLDRIRSAMQSSNENSHLPPS